MSKKYSFKISNRITLTMAFRLVLITLAATVASYLHISSIVKSLIEEDLKKYIVLRGERESQLFELASRDQISLRDRYVDHFKKDWRFEGEALKQKFDEIFARFPDGAIREKKEIDNRKHPSYFIKKGTPLSPGLMRSTLLIYDFLDRECFVTTNTFSDCWIADHYGGFGTILPADEGYGDQAEAEFDSLSQEWMTPNFPENNPKREQKWTNAYLDVNLNTWLVTLVTPIDIDGRFYGAIGNDIVVGQFFRRILDSNLEGTTNFVFTSDGILIAHPEYEDEIVSKGGSLKVSDLRENSPSMERTFEYVKSISHRENDLTKQPVIDLDSDSLLAITKIAGPNWYLATIYPKAMISAAALRASRYILLFGCLSLFVEVILLIQIIRTRLARPLKDLVGVVEKVAAGDLTAKATASSNDEFEMLGDAFNEMTHNLETSREELERSMIKAMSAAKSQSEFVSNISHEMRNPLNGIVGMAQFLEESKLSEEQAKYAAFIAESSNHLLTIINRVLDVSKIEANKVEIESVEFKMKDLLQEVRAIIVFEAEKKGLKLVIEDRGDAEATFVGDVGRIKQILVNLGSNAIKFSDKGSILIRVKSIGEVDGERWLRFDVIDEGIGMSEEVRNKLFEAFTQGDSSMARKYGGTGLGLYLVKSFVQLLKGRVGVESLPGKGSEFWFEIPLKIVVAPKEVKARTIPDIVAPRADLKPVLMVDDMPVNRTITEAYLKRLGLIGVHAVDGQNAVDLFEPGRFSLILMDCQMPVMDGFEASRCIRQKEKRESRVTILALTANTQESDRQACLQAGMDDMISKPVKFAAFKEKIEAWLPQGDSASTL